MADKKHLTNKELHKKVKALKKMIIANRVFGSNRVGGSLGMTHGGARDIYESAGYIRNPKFRDYNNKYERMTVAKRVVNSYPNACFSQAPTIRENNKMDDTEFEKDIKNLFTNKKVLSRLRKADILSRIGEYGVILLGLDDARQLNKPVEPSKVDKLLYMQQFSQKDVTIKEFYIDTSLEKYNTPKIYEIKLNQHNKGTNTAKTRKVHESRIIHLAEDALEVDWKGTPALKPIFNRIQDIETIMAGSSEAFWRGGFPGYVFNADPDMDMEGQSLKNLEEEIGKWMNSMQRHLRLQGIEAKTLDVNISSPREHIDTNISLISSAKGIPKRILIGAEQGELASVTDKDNWLSSVDKRRKHYVEPDILRPFINRMIKFGIIAAPVNDYSIIFPDITVISEKDKAQIAKAKSVAISTYASQPNSELVVPSQFFLTDFLDVDKDRAKEYQKAAETILDEKYTNPSDGEGFEHTDFPQSKEGDNA